jgi:hypothetical protein
MIFRNDPRIFATMRTQRCHAETTTATTRQCVVGNESLVFALSVGRMNKTRYRETRAEQMNLANQFGQPAARTVHLASTGTP